MPNLVCDVLGVACPDRFSQIIDLVSAAEHDLALTLDSQAYCFAHFIKLIPRGFVLWALQDVCVCV